MMGKGLAQFGDDKNAIASPVTQDAERTEAENKNTGENCDDDDVDAM